MLDSSGGVGLVCGMKRGIVGGEAPLNSTGQTYVLAGGVISRKAPVFKPGDQLRPLV